METFTKWVGGWVKASPREILGKFFQRLNIQSFIPLNFAPIVAVSEVGGVYSVYTEKRAGKQGRPCKYL